MSTITHTPATTGQIRQISRLGSDAIEKALEELGISKESTQALIENGDKFQTYIMSGIRRFTSYKLARTILGEDFISPEEVARSHRDCTYTDSQFSQFGNTVPSKEVLEWCRDNDYMLVAGPPRPMSLFDIRDLNRDNFCTAKYDTMYVDGRDTFVLDDMVNTQWIMLRKEHVPGSTNKKRDEQQTLLSKDESIPNVALVAWCVATYRAVRGVYLFRKVRVRTSSSERGDFPADIGCAKSEGNRILVIAFYCDQCIRWVGIASVRKS